MDWKDINSDMGKMVESIKIMVRIMKMMVILMRWCRHKSILWEAVRIITSITYVGKIIITHIIAITTAAITSQQKQQTTLAKF